MFECFIYGERKKIKSQIKAYLYGEDPTHPDDAEDVEDGRAHDGADPHVPFSDENTCTKNAQTPMLKIVVHMNLTRVRTSVYQ